MKKLISGIPGWMRTINRIAALVLSLSLNSCTEDVFEGADNYPVGNENGYPELMGSANYDNYMLRYDDSGNTYFRINYAGSGFGSQTQDGSNLTAWLSGWDHIAGLDVKGHHYLALHSGKKEFAIREITAAGLLGPETCRQNWNGNYETFFGFHVGDRGFIFGQDSYGGHYWFVQEVSADGKLASNECDNGEWNNYYPTATPFYVNGKTYLFFEEEGGYLASTRYWFISSVSADGRLTDLCDGRWAHYWERVTSVEIDGKTFLIGNRKDSGNGGGEYFINRINADGTMGPETDRGLWNNYYKNFTAFVNNNMAYLYGCAGNNESNGLNYFFQLITSDGKMGAETSHGISDKDYDFSFPFTIYNAPGSFRYTIGWDLTKSTTSPVRSWSEIFKDPWHGLMKFGGGTALADIDRDAGNKFDAFFCGIQDCSGADRFYYKVAFNLDATGVAGSWSNTFFGPECGEAQSGGGADIADIDGNGIPDLLLMSVDNPDMENSFRYNIGWNLNSNGSVSSWSSKIQGPSLGWDNSGGGAALGDIDQNGRPDVVFMGIDNPEKENTFWYIIGQNLDKSGKATSWTSRITAPCYLGWVSAGGGAALADIDGNGRLDLVLTSIDNPPGPNNFWCFIGWNIDTKGNVTGWSAKYSGPSPGNITVGGGAAIADIDKNGKPDLLLMSVDNPYGTD